MSLFFVHFDYYLRGFSFYFFGKSQDSHRDRNLEVQFPGAQRATKTPCLMSFFTAIYCVCSVNESLFCSLWLLFTRFLSKKCFFFGQTQSKTIDPGTRSRKLPEASPKARLKPYFSRACPQDDVSSTRQTPSNQISYTRYHIIYQIFI